MIISRGKRGEIIFDEVHQEDFRFRNFSGHAGMHNREGEKSFGVYIYDPEIVQRLTDEGWTVSIERPRNEGEDPKRYLGIKVTKFRRDGNGMTSLPPMYLYKNGNHGKLNEQTVIDLDDVEIEESRIVVRGYEYEPGKLSAWLNSMDVLIADNPFERKYGRPKHEDDYMNEPEGLPFN